MVNEHQHDVWKTMENHRRNKGRPPQICRKKSWGHPGGRILEDGDIMGRTWKAEYVLGGVARPWKTKNIQLGGPNSILRFFPGANALLPHQPTFKAAHPFLWQDLSTNQARASWLQMLTFSGAQLAELVL